jgi:hypothetical protein
MVTIRGRFLENPLIKLFNISRRDSVGSTKISELLPLD